jgi:ribonuclease HI
MNDIIIYTDGSCKSNPGIGGYAAIILGINDNESVTVISGGESHTTNNRMELTAVLQALKHIDEVEFTNPIIIRTDSQYIVRAINERWLENWITNYFKGIKNQDLWLIMWKYICKLNVTFEWLKGHDGDKFNEMADRLANEACYFQGKPFTYKLPL